MRELDQYRTAARQAAGAVTARPGVAWEFGGAPPALAYLAWHGKSWVTDFPSVEAAQAYFARADQVGIDYDYGAVLDLSEPRNPALAWDRLGPGPARAVTSGGPVTSPQQRLAQLWRMIEQHDAFWTLGAGDDPATAAWAAQWWTPWHGRLVAALAARTDLVRRALSGQDNRLTTSLVRELSGSLSWLREGAERAGIPIPDLGSKKRGFETTNSSGDLMHSVGRGHGHGHGGAGSRRRYYGGSWGYWPYPWPYYGTEEVEEEVVSGRGGGRRRRRRQASYDPSQDQAQQQPQQPPVQEGDASSDVVGAARAAWRRSSPDNELIDMLPAIAPGAGGMYFQAHLGPDLQLRAQLCVDGRCYQTVADLSHAVSSVASSVSRTHDRLRAAQDSAALAAPSAADSPEAVTEMATQTQDAVQSASQAVLGALYDQHVQSVSAGFWDSIKDAVSTVSKPANWITQNVGKVLQTPGIKEAVTTVATAAATTFGGPAAGLAAAKLTGPLIDQAASGRDPVSLITQAKKHAGPDPATHRAIDHAHRAISQSAAAAHITATAGQAAAGDPAAGRKIRELDQAAASGDPAAAQAMRMISQVFNLAGQGRGSRGQPDLSSVVDDARGFWDRISSQSDPSQPDPSLADPGVDAGDPMPPEEVSASGEWVGSSVQRSAAAASRRALRREGAAAAQALSSQGGAQFVGYVKVSGSGASPTHSNGVVVALDDTSFVQSFGSVDEADTWFGSLDQLGIGEVLYAAYYDAGDPTWPNPLNERFGRRPGQGEGVVTQGLLPWLALGAAAGGGYAWWRHRKAASATAAAQHMAEAHAATSPQAPAPTTSGFWPIIPLAVGLGAGMMYGSSARDHGWVDTLRRESERGNSIYYGDQPIYVPYAPPPHGQAPTTSSGGPLLPLALLAAGGGAGWFGHSWWQDRQRAHAAAAAQSPGSAPNPSVGWW